MFLKVAVSGVANCETLDGDMVGRGGLGARHIQQHSHGGGHKLARWWATCSVLSGC